MNTHSSAEPGRSRLIAALALLAILLGVATAGSRLGGGAGLFAAADDGGRWLVQADELQPAKIERGLDSRADKAASGSSPQPLALAPAAARPPRSAVVLAFRPTPADPAGGDPPRYRPDPTGPPLLG